MYGDLPPGGDGGYSYNKLFIYKKAKESFSVLAVLEPPNGSFFTFEVNHLWVPGTTDTNRYSSLFSTDTWSPNSDKVVLTFTRFSWNENDFEQYFGFCVIMVSTEHQICEENDSQSKYYGMSNFAWSSSGRFLALIAPTIDGNDIFIYDTDTEVFYLLAKNTRGVALYWR